MNVRLGPDRRHHRATRARRRRDGRAYSAILVDHRNLYSELLYEFRDARDLPPVRMYVLRAAPGNQAEAAAPMTANLSARVLVVHMWTRYELAEDFARFSTFARIETPIGPRKRRPIALSDASGFRPRAHTPEFLGRVGD